MLSALFLIPFRFKHLVLFGLPDGYMKLFHRSGFMSAESVPLSSGVTDSRCFEGTVYFLGVFLRNVQNKWLCYSVSQPRRLESSISTLWKPRFSVSIVNWLTDILFESLVFYIVFLDYFVGVPEGPVLRLFSIFINVLGDIREQCVWHLFSDVKTVFTLNLPVIVLCCYLIQMP